MEEGTGKKNYVRLQKALYVLGGVCYTCVSGSIIVVGGRYIGKILRCFPKSLQAELSGV